MQVEEIAELVHRDTGEQPEELLPFDACVGLVLRAARHYLGQLSSSDLMQSNSVTGEWAPQDPEGVFPFQDADQVRVAYVERRLDDFGRRWEPVSVVKVSQINDLAAAGKDAVAFYDNYRMYRLSWDPADRGYADVLRAHRDLVFSAVMRLSEEPNFPARFHEMIADKATLWALPLLIAADAKAKRGHFVETDKGKYPVGPDKGLIAFVDFQTSAVRERLRERETEWDFYRFESPEQQGFDTPSFTEARRRG